MSMLDAPEGAPISYERYMSSPESPKYAVFQEQRWRRKRNYIDARKRSLLFFLQSLSLKEGGLRRIAHALLERFPAYCEQELADLLVDAALIPRLLSSFLMNRRQANPISHC